MSSNESLLVGVPEAARLFGVSVNHMWRFVWNGDIPSIRLGKRVMVPRSALSAMVDRAIKIGELPAAGKQTPHKTAWEAHATKPKPQMVKPMTDYGSEAQ